MTFRVNSSHIWLNTHHILNSGPSFPFLFAHKNQNDTSCSTRIRGKNNYWEIAVVCDSQLLSRNVKNNTSLFSHPGTNRKIKHFFNYLRLFRKMKPQPSVAWWSQRLKLDYAVSRWVLHMTHHIPSNNKGCDFELVSGTNASLMTQQLIWLSWSRVGFQTEWGVREMRHEWGCYRRQTSFLPGLR